MRMSKYEFAALIARITYKPGWSFRVLDENHPDAYTVRMTAVWPSIHPPHEEIPVTRDVHFFHSHDLTVEQMVAMLYNSVTAHERHEQDEWFKIGEAWYNNPHGDKPRRVYHFAPDEKI